MYISVIVYTVSKLTVIVIYFFFNDTATTEIYTYLHTLSLHDALPICLIDILPTLYLRVAEIIQNHGLIRRQLVGPFQLCPGFVPLSCLFKCAAFEQIQ